MSAEGYLPAKYATCPRPVCVACQFGKAHKKPCRTKAKASQILRNTDTQPGDTVSTYSFTSTTPGLIPQIYGTRMAAKYHAGTVFVDHATEYTYFHNQIDQSAESAIEAKEDFERQMHEHGVTVRSYHADNGIFK